MGQTARRSIATHILAVKMALAAAHFHGFGVARQGPWITSVNNPSFSHSSTKFIGNSSLPVTLAISDLDVGVSKMYLSERNFLPCSSTRCCFSPFLFDDLHQGVHHAGAQ
jgi:hypothetical protein